MRKLFLKFFYVPKYGKVQENVLLARLVVTVTVVILCLAMMSITAYAYFSHNVTSNFNTIQAANFEADVHITIKDSGNTPVAVVKDGKLQTATLDSGTYTVELSKGASTAKTGFCIVTIGNTKYYTQQIGVDVQRNLNDANVTFTIKVSSATTVKILSHWGTSSCYGYKETSTNPVYLESGDAIDLTISTSSNNDTPSNQEQGSSESTTNTNPTEAPSQESSTPSTETTEASEPTVATEPSSTTETTTQTTEPEETSASTETQPDTQPRETSTTEGNNE